MIRTTTHPPSATFISLSDRCATVEVLIPVEPDRGLGPWQLDDLLEEVVERVDRALEGIFAGLPAAVRIDDIASSSPRHVPFYPAAVGDRIYGSSAEIEEAVEELRKGTHLEGTVRDSAGRRFKATVWLSFRRVDEEDL